MPDTAENPSPKTLPFPKKDPSPLEKIRLRFNELMTMTPVSPELMLAHLLKIVKDCEKHRTDELREVENMKRKILASEAKAEGFSVMSAIVYNVVNSFALGAEATKKEDEELAETEAEKASGNGETPAPVEAAPAAPKSKGNGKPKVVKTARKTTRSRRGKGQK